MSRTMFTGYTVEIRGLDNLLNWLRHANPKLEKALKKALKDATKPVLQRARANAKRIQDDATYAESLSIATRKGGAQYVLKSTDPNAPVKEFAHEGAVMVKSRTNTDRSREMVRRHARVGVPHRANAPRVMVPAVEDSADEVRERIEKCMAEVLKEAQSG